MMVMRELHGEGVTRGLSIQALQPHTDEDDEGDELYGH